MLSQCRAALVIALVLLFQIVQVIESAKECTLPPYKAFVENGTKIGIKGILNDVELNETRKEFSINFVNEHCKDPEFITYHFKWLLDEHVIVENYKDHGVWINHQEKDFDGIDGVLFAPERLNGNSSEQYNSTKNNNNNDDDGNNNDNILDYSVLGSIFELEFAFHTDHIYVYRIYENTPNYITSYEPFFDISDIKALQVWGDVKKVTEVSFRYPAN